MLDQFITSRYGDATGRMSIWWRRKPGRTPYNESKWFSYPQEIDKIAAEIEASSDRDVCITTSLYSADSRIPEKATVTASVWMDSDTCEGSNYRVSPTWTVQTSDGRWQHHWDLIEVVPTEQASEVSHRMAVAHRDQGADPSSWSANKIMRVPGTSNTSHGVFPEEVTATNSGTIYSIQELQEAYADVDLDAPTAIMGHADAPTDVKAPESLPPYGDAVDKLPEHILAMVTAIPASGGGGYRSELRWKMLARMFDEVPDLTFEEVLSISWHAPASKKWAEEDPRGLSGLIAEATKIYNEVQLKKNSGTPPERAADYDDPTPVATGVSLLSSGERAECISRKTWVDIYSEWAGSKVAKQNAAYDRINAWTILSAAFAREAFIPRKNGPENLVLYTMTMGDTTTGKSQALKLWRTCMGEVFIEDPGWDIGGNASENALSAHLIERDGLVSVFNRDEAQGLFKVWRLQDWSKGLMDSLSQLYDGYLPPMLRMGKSDTNGKSAKPFLIMHLMGTPDEMVQNLTREMFTQGFLARFITAVGEPREITRESMAEEDGDGTEAKRGFDVMARQFATEFKATKIKMRTKHGDGRFPVTISQDAAKRMGQVKWDLVNLVQKGDQNFDILNPSLVRMGVTIRKAASLLALADGRDHIELGDVQHAIIAAEEWVANLIDIAGRISASDFQRACDEVESFVLDVTARKGEPPTKAAVIRRFKHVETRYLTGYLESLFAQNRLYEFKDNATYYIAQKERA